MGMKKALNRKFSFPFIYILMGYASAETGSFKKTLKKRQEKYLTHPTSLLRILQLRQGEQHSQSLKQLSSPPFMKQEQEEVSS